VVGLTGQRATIFRGSMKIKKQAVYAACLEFHLLNIKLFSALYNELAV
jgi:hypothetical protein